ncbi:DegV family protein [Agrilactobacillus composti DSM 18527 = JCM 14202]|uniref:DegV family protein n=1 Tax=Agrilactobacillus composti DSM 18527 = JCM 14202 TaxID=1423734 RepID=X0PU14_9LACO|nr:DegV family protein [Agrilactobacillus composti]KRM30913.1 DegV family protein [Agrilactobacillus composti DSM 18527 = JCM 14202]GAF40851.1 DegV family protein [Agrilactobacillus composti DSM 18527 = JCM 14202]
MSFILSCESTADLSQAHFDARQIHYVPFHFSIDGKQYLDDLGQSIPFDEFYAEMANGAQTETSQVNVAEFIQYFTRFLEAGQDILHVSLSSGLSGVMNAAMVAKEQLDAKYPQRKIEIIDSLAASSGYGLLMDKLADLRDAGKSIDAVKSWAEENKLSVHHWFISTDLSYYVRLGRLSKVSGWFGTQFHIVPLLDMDATGHLTPRKKLRGKKLAEKALVDQMVAHAEQGTDYSGKCYISQSAFYDDAKNVATMIEARFPKLNGPVEINHIGTTIGSHTGPGTIALFFWGDKR